MRRKESAACCAS